MFVCDEIRVGWSSWHLTDDLEGLPVLVYLINFIICQFRTDCVQGMYPLVYQSRKWKSAPLRMIVADKHVCWSPWPVAIKLIHQNEMKSSELMEICWVKFVTNCPHMDIAMSTTDRANFTRFWIPISDLMCVCIVNFRMSTDRVSLNFRV